MPRLNGMETQLQGTWSVGYTARPQLSSKTSTAKARTLSPHVALFLIRQVRCGLLATFVNCLKASKVLDTFHCPVLVDSCEFMTLIVLGMYCTSIQFPNHFRVASCFSIGDALSAGANGASPFVVHSSCSISLCAWVQWRSSLVTVNLADQLGEVLPGQVNAASFPKEVLLGYGQQPFKHQVRTILWPSRRTSSRIRFGNSA